MKKSMTLALAASIFTLALTANPHTALAYGRAFHYTHGGCHLRLRRLRRHQLAKRLSWASSVPSTRWCFFKASAAIYCPAAGAGSGHCAFRPHLLNNQPKVASFLKRRTIMHRITLTTLLLLAPLSVFAAVNPAVQNGTVNYAANQVTLTGSGFRPEKAAPTVELDGAKLKIDFSSNATIMATLPAAIPAGTFNLKVKNSDGKDTSFDLAYGATGPRGPAGAGGAQGLEGSQGPTGATGPAGPAGPAAPAMTFVVAELQADVPLPGDAQNHLVNSLGIPNGGTYLIQGMQALQVDMNIYCWVAAIPLGRRELAHESRPVANASVPVGNGGLPAFHVGTQAETDLFATVPIFGYYVAPAGGATIQLWCRQDLDAIAFAHASGANGLDDTQTASMLSALQIQ
jgi:hypothetical protein